MFVQERERERERVREREIVLKPTLFTFPASRIRFAASKGEIVTLLKCFTTSLHPIAGICG